MRFQQFPDLFFGSHLPFSMIRYFQYDRFFICQLREQVGKLFDGKYRFVAAIVGEYDLIDVFDATSPR